jgi:uncharacterized protein (DUF2147 family)
MLKFSFPIRNVLNTNSKTKATRLTRIGFRSTSFLGVILGVILILGQPLKAEETTPAGLWRTIDDATGKAKSIMRVAIEKGELTATIDSLLPEEGKDPNRSCEKCTGKKKGQRLKGMQIAWGLKGDGKSFEGGHILDPGNGKVYRCKVEMSDDGKRLTVRGFIGISLIGRSQTWHRQ